MDCGGVKEDGCSRRDLKIVGMVVLVGVGFACFFS